MIDKWGLTFKRSIILSFHKQALCCEQLSKRGCHAYIIRFSLWRCLPLLWHTSAQVGRKKGIRRRSGVGAGQWGETSWLLLVHLSVTWKGLKKTPHGNGAEDDTWELPFRPWDQGYDLSLLVLPGSTKGLNSDDLFVPNAFFFYSEISYYCSILEGTFILIDFFLLIQKLYW